LHGNGMKQQRAKIRIIAGDLRGRRIACTVHDELRPTPDAVRQALFSILGDAVPERPFIDVFAGTGAVGIEAISRGAKSSTLIERDFALAAQIGNNLKEFQVSERGRVVRADVYRWVERWQPIADEPVNVFLSPPFADLTHRIEGFLALVAALRAKVPVGSTLTVQAELGFPEEQLPGEGWERRAYGRNLLFIWVRT
jgi:16S rRNA (guanine966-N2)-methyltransferase